MKKLIVYYSQARGNTRRIAKMIQQATGADLEEIETVTPYTGSYDEIVNQGQREVNSGFTPEIKPLQKALASYDEIILGTPTWWYTMAPAVRTFLSQNDLTGKKVVLFQTHGGWPAHCLKDMEKMAGGADIVSTYAVQFDSTGGDHLETPLADIERWMQTLK
ncbi:flavodoxin [uncultured Selenomonas sp.]|uniref:flavodoxin family protein n=1 Tax=uncultured Selenomonas sp. TaxID=159275 RepID=UPI0025E43391|nr:flavodoxin [uncultured Selenomonas sp.]